jgi:hypothetical protein
MIYLQCQYTNVQCKITIQKEQKTYTYRILRTIGRWGR